MSDYEHNVYSHPENVGLELIGALDEPDLSYEYNTLIAVNHKESGRVFWASNSGCSCPTPFEDFYFNGPDENNLEEVKLHNWSAFIASVKSWSLGYDGETAKVPQHERDAFIDDVLRVLKQSVTSGQGTIV